MLELFQFEGCKECARVRQKLSELMLDFVARQVPADRTLRAELKAATGQSDVPILLDHDKGMVVTEADDIIAYLVETYPRPAQAPSTGPGAP